MLTRVHATRLSAVLHFAMQPEVSKYEQSHQRDFGSTRECDAIKNTFCSPWHSALWNSSLVGLASFTRGRSQRDIVLSTKSSTYACEGDDSAQQDDTKKSIERNSERVGSNWSCNVHVSCIHIACTHVTCIPVARIHVAAFMLHAFKLPHPCCMQSCCMRSNCMHSRCMHSCCPHSCCMLSNLSHAFMLLAFKLSEVCGRESPQTREFTCSSQMV